MGDDRGCFAPTTPGCRLWIRRLHERRANAVRREATERPGGRHTIGAAADLRTGAGQKVSDIRCGGASLEDVYYSRQLARNQTGKVEEWCCLCDLPCCEGLKAAR